MAHDTLKQMAWLLGALFTSLAYGMAMLLYILCTCLYWRQNLKEDRPQRMKQAAFFLYATIIFIMGTLYFVALVWCTVTSYVEHRCYPGGPSAYEAVIYPTPIDMMGNGAYVAANWMADGLMIWRCLFLYKITGCGHLRWLFAAVPSFMYISSSVLGVIWLVRSSHDPPGPNGGTSVHYTLPYLALSLVSNMVVTALIVGRLWCHRRSVRKSLGPAYGKQYTSMASMYIDSAALFSVNSILCLVTLAIGSPIENIFMQMLGEVQIISALMIVYRVMQNRERSEPNVEVLSTNIVVPGITASALHFARNASSPSLTDSFYGTTNHGDDGPADLNSEGESDSDASRDCKLSEEEMTAVDSLNIV